MPRRDWEKLFHEYKASGETAQFFCAKRGLDAGSFSRGTKKFRKDEPIIKPDRLLTLVKEETKLAIREHLQEAKQTLRVNAPIAANTLVTELASEDRKLAVTVARDILDRNGIGIDNKQVQVNVIIPPLFAAEDAGLIQQFEAGVVDGRAIGREAADTD